MNKRIYDMALGWMGILLFTACTSTSPAGSHESPLDTKAPIEFGSKVTRAAVDAEKNGMSDFLVWGGYGNSHNNLFDAETVTKDGTYTGTRYWVPGETHNFYALHPAGLTKGTTDKVAQNVECTDGKLTVTNFDTSINKGSAAIDLMTASATNLNGTTPSPVPLTFSHELSRVKFTISTDATLTITNVKLWNIDYKGSFTTAPTANSPWSELTRATENDTPFLQTEAFELKEKESRHLLGDKYDEKNDNYGDLLLIPQELSHNSELSTPNMPDLSNSMTFFMTWKYADGTEKSVTVPLNMAGPSSWAKGKYYQYKATIPSRNTDIQFTVTVTDWNDKRIDADL